MKGRKKRKGERKAKKSGKKCREKKGGREKSRIKYEECPRKGMSG